MVRVSIFKKPLVDRPHQDPREAVRHEVVIQASMIVEIDDGGQYLVQFGMSCGEDYTDSSQSYEGTKKSKITKSLIKSQCDEFGLRIGPGVIEI